MKRNMETNKDLIMLKNDIQSRNLKQVRQSSLTIQLKTAHSKRDTQIQGIENCVLLCRVLKNTLSSKKY